MKLENIFLGENYNVKIGDFGFAGPKLGRDGKGHLTTRFGTRTYMAPEIIESKSYSGELVDIFAAGVILFIMVAGTYPFTQAVKEDDLFRFIYHKQWDKYWSFYIS